MPYYDFLNKKTGEIKSLFFHMNDEKKYVDEFGLEWTRQFSIPQASIDSKLDPNDPKSFVKYTETRAGKYGDLLDLSKECSEKRKDKNGGYDHVEEKMYDNYSKARKGKKHPNVKKRELKEQMKKNPIFDIDI